MVILKTFLGNIDSEAIFHVELQADFIAVVSGDPINVHGTWHCARVVLKKWKALLTFLWSSADVE